jgi:predicted enzyme related to lactoylglutathione lyase
MTMTRTGAGWIPADEYGRGLPAFTVNLLVKDVARSLPFYRDVLGVTVRHVDADFAALNLQGTDFMLHADHTYDHHPLYARVRDVAVRGTGAEIRVMGIDPDAAEARAKKFGATVVQEARDFPHGWRDVMLADPDGYVWAVGVGIGGTHR